MSRVVTVAIPVRNGGRLLIEALAAVRAQRLPDGVDELELLIADSGSIDGSLQAAESSGARVLAVGPGEFSHSGTRNRLMEEARGEFVAFLTQDAVPASEGWLAALLSGFSLAEDVALVYGPYRPRPDAPPPVARELNRWFASLGGPAGAPRVDRVTGGERSGPTSFFYGPLGFFTDANGAVRRSAWERVPFPPVAYAEDHALAVAMLRAGFAKVFVPKAVVIHSHEYSLAGWVRRSFDETRAVSELYGVGAEIGSLRTLGLGVRGALGADRRSGAGQRELLASALHHGSRAVGAALGARAGRLPAGFRRRLSLEGRP